MSRALDQRRAAAVIRLCRRARAHAGRSRRAEAMSCLLEAWELLPEPKESWGASAYVLAGFADLVRAGADPFSPPPRHHADAAA